ncbi:non-ribosomal peptide synthetase [Streptomyces albus]|uniref:Non-ribosomal peptide synthetase n=1 Tax=Streptomyces albus (strain ATCC 21838 / DSM 41398 / FERM P-419 / JCM 4703 / NBRC 107858) TaxID=1081613 RepID=A0A0B5EPM5_STRA4|nr:non-ribosomal peptide synthetase [Streptomyces albus]AOU79029.1 non-ribosomal peptide synthetase [Streptomyces albus]
MTATIPRWTRAPAPGTAHLDAPLPGELITSVRELAETEGTAPGAVLLAAHAKVLAALTGEREVTTGCVDHPGGPPVPLRLTVADGSWRSLIREAARATETGGATAASDHRHRDRDDQRQDRQQEQGRQQEAEYGQLAPTPETVLDPAGILPAGILPADNSPANNNPAGNSPAGDSPAAENREPPLAPTTVLSLTLLRPPHQPHPPQLGAPAWTLRLRYRTDVLDEEAATRIAGYHRTALALLTADPEAAHERQSLLSAEELEFQLYGLAGPERELPDQRFHELFEERVRERPEDVVAVCGARELTYRELNRRANRLAHALLDAGLRRQEVVAVVAERTPDWMAAVLAVFKAGGAYLPVEPHFPAERVATMLGRASCRLVLSGPGATAALARARETVPGLRVLSLGEADEDSHKDSDPGIRVAPDDLAYLYFTSGSTGEPKGAMCEHAGMLNHLLAKTGDLGIGEGDVVAQTAPQCFDISLWQLLAGPLAGGRTLLVPQQAVLDVEEFLDTLVRGRVNVLQVVPSYLEVVLSALERNPRRLPDLRCVSVTGEALRKELVERWFAARPGVRLVNAYGLTETSDDTNHEIMDRVPEGERVPIGRPVRNARVYVVDEQLAPVPLGAPGALVFSGVCVGRGYVGDPERTAAAYTGDPYRAGERLYQGGDFGRWRPGGTLEFLGRRDSQVKIRGFRIEIGEIESALLRTPGVRDTAVVVSPPAGQGQRLIAFCAGPHPLAPEALRARLAETLPAYLVPAAFPWLDALPLTANGKTDRTALTARAERLDPVPASESEPESEAGPGKGPGSGPVATGSPTEERLAAAWAEVLGIPRARIGRRDDFFGLGGTSLTGVRLAISLDREVSLRDLTEYPVLADLAALVDARGRRRETQPPPSPPQPQPQPDQQSQPDQTAPGTGTPGTERST